MEHDVLSVREAAEKLGVSSQRIRQLIKDGRLPAHRSSAGWFIRAEAVANRAGSAPHGRPASARTAWAVLDLLGAAVAPGAAGASSAAAAPPAHVRAADVDPLPEQSALSPDDAAMAVKASQVISDRRLRHHVRLLLSTIPDPIENIGQWRLLLASRGPARRVWAHPGVLARLKDDPRISIGGAEAAISFGDGLLGTSRLDLYVGEADLEHVIAEYRLRQDADGQITIHIVPESVPPDLAPRPGAPVPVAAAAADLLEEDDARAIDAGLHQLRVMRNAVVHGGWARPGKKPETASPGPARDKT